MFSTDPTNLLRKDNLDEEEMIRALRGALMAELDAINYYLQRGRLFSDERLKKVHDNIAKEEITHFGEFLRLLYLLNREEFDYILKGWNEASRLIGKEESLPIPLEMGGQGHSTMASGRGTGTHEVKNEEKAREQIRYIIDALSARKIRAIGNVVEYPRESILVDELVEDTEEILQGDKPSIYEIPRISQIV